MNGRNIYGNTLERWHLSPKSARVKLPDRMRTCASTRYSADLFTPLFESL
jgi:hypothetical protein